MKYTMSLVIKKNDEELMHHGVKGMKWGVRKTPEERGTYYGSKKHAVNNKNMNKTARSAYAKARIAQTGSAKKAKSSETKHLLGSYVKKGAAFVGSNALTTLGVTMAIGTGGASAAAVAMGAAFVNKAVHVGLGVSAVTGTVRTIKNKKAIKRESAA